MKRPGEVYSISCLSFPSQPTLFNACEKLLQFGPPPPPPPPNSVPMEVSVWGEEGLSTAFSVREFQVKLGDPQS